MCDEYDDERMWAFWRRLEQTEQEKDLREEPREVEIAPLAVLSPPGETRKARPRPLVR